MYVFVLQRFRASPHSPLFFHLAMASSSGAEVHTLPQGKVTAKKKTLRMSSTLGDPTESLQGNRELRSSPVTTGEVPPSRPGSWLKDSATAEPPGPVGLKHQDTTIENNTRTRAELVRAALAQMHAERVSLPNTTKSRERSVVASTPSRVLRSLDVRTTRKSKQDISGEPKTNTRCFSQTDSAIRRRKERAHFKTEDAHPTSHAALHHPFDDIEGEEAATRPSGPLPPRQQLLK